VNACKKKKKTQQGNADSAFLTQSPSSQETGEAQFCTLLCSHLEPDQFTWIHWLLNTTLWKVSHINSRFYRCVMDSLLQLASQSVSYSRF